MNFIAPGRGESNADSTFVVIPGERVSGRKGRGGKEEGRAKARRAEISRAITSGYI